MAGSWTEADLPRLEGKTAVVTGANSGLGLETTRLLAGRGARVILVCRTEAKAQSSIAGIRQDHPEADLELAVLDLADLASVRRGAERIAAQAPQIDLLVNNAGVMALPRRTTADGFEMQLGTNHFGHFALTALLWPQLRAGGAVRVVTLTSLFYRIGRMRWDDLDGEVRYHKWRAYGQSKLANMLFTQELQRRIDRAGLPMLSVAAHPGYASTNLALEGPRMEGAGFRARINALGGSLVAQSARAGAWPTLRAATAPDVRGGELYGPAVLGMWGAPRREPIRPLALDEDAARRLWELSEARTGVRFEV